MSNKKILSIGLSIVVLTVTCFIPTDGFADNASTIKKSQEELKRINQELKKLDQSKNQIKQERRAVVKRINNIQGNIQGLESEISGIEGKIKSTEGSIQKAKGELHQAENGITLKKDVLSSRLRAMYKMGHVGYLDVLLGSTDFGDMLTRIDMLQKIYKQDTDLLQKMKSQRDSVQAKKSSLEAYKSQLMGYTTSLSVKQSALGKDLQALSVEQKNLQKDAAALEEQEDKLLEDSKRIQKILESMKSTHKYVGGKMGWPAPDNYKISSPYGYRIHPVYKKRKLHTGVDISTHYADPITAAQDGTVILADWFGGYGKAVMIDHGGGYVTLYAHNSSLVVSTGQKVKRGQKIAKSGSTGVSTGNHLHFEVRVNGKHVDPLPWLK